MHSHIKGVGAGLFGKEDDEREMAKVETFLFVSGVYFCCNLGRVY